MAIEKNNVVAIEQRFGASVPRVFDALKQGRLFLNCGAWPSGTEIDFRVGGKYRLDFGHHGAATGEFTEIVENRKVGFTWKFEEAGHPTRVLIELSPEGEGCILRLRHEGFEDLESAKDVDGGWTCGLGDLGTELAKRSVKIEREFQAPVAMLYQACSGMNFFSNLGAIPAKSKVDFRVGGEYRCELDEGKEIRGKFLEIVPEKKVVFSWESAPCGVKLTQPTRVTMEFGPWGEDGKSSYVELTHEGFTEDAQVYAHHEGWNMGLRKIYDRARR